MTGASLWPALVLSGARQIGVEIGTGFNESRGTEAREDNHLGTHLQFVFRLAVEYRLGGTELSLAAVHYSNGKSLFGWDGPNTGENFATLQLAREF